MATISIDRFITKALIRRGRRMAFVEVRVEPQQKDIEIYGITSREEYEALVHYLLRHNEQFLTTLHPDVLPTVIYFGEQNHPQPDTVNDFTQYDARPDRATAAKTRVKIRRCLCEAPCGRSPTSYCCVYWYEDVDLDEGPVIV